MEGKKRSYFIEWIVYGLALVSLTVLIYLFSTRNNTSIMVEDSEIQKVKESPTQKISKDSTDIIKSYKKSHINIESPTDNTSDQDSIQSEPSPVQVPKAERNKDQLISNKAKITHQKNNRHPTKKRANRNNSCSCECVCPNNIGSGRSTISGFTKYKHPVLVPYKKYNWVVLKRFPQKPSKPLYKVGTYKIRSGDNIYVIAKKFRVAFINVMAINKLNNPDILVVGRKIFIPNR